MAHICEKGDLVWAKLKGYPFWPGIIEDFKEVKSKKQYWVHFYGSDNSAWIPDQMVVLHSEGEVKKAQEKKMSSQFKASIDEIVKQASLRSGGKKETSTDSKRHSATLTDNAMEIQETELPAKSPVKAEVHSPKPKTLKRKLFPLKEKPKKKILTKRKKEDTLRKVNLLKQEEGLSDLFANISSNLTSNSRVAIIKPYDDNLATTSQSGGHIAKRDYFELKTPPRYDFKNLSENMMAKKDSIEPTKLKIGFIGLGSMGMRIVKNLILTGHDVTIWNRSSAKCKPFIAIGASEATIPADVVEAADIIFSCVSSSDVVDNLVFGNCGVLSCLEARKGYVEMTTIDSDTSIKIAEAIALKGGRYLEAPICGSRTLAEDGMLSIIAAGDQDLYEDCSSCFKAISKTTYFLGAEIGVGSKMNLIANTVLGVSYAGLAEALVLIERLGLSSNMFMEVLKLSPLNSATIVNKARCMMDRNFQTDSSLKHLQQDICMTLSLAGPVKQSMLVSSSANNVYKHAELLRYSDHDVAAVYCGVKY